ncbi:MAG TPA: hypothetical protein VKE40_27870 [Gemmataceae bacterium]|nr:hypothetical protein [Gemmataceae bacterium]
MWSTPPNHPLRRLFAGLTEHAFLTAIGVTDPPLIDYVSELLTRFTHFNAVYRLQGPHGRPLTEVAEMVMEAEEIPPEGRTRREYHRHIGDFTLFWTGLFPEAVKRQEAGWSRDSFVSYTLQGKRSYLIAGSFDDDMYREESAVLKRLGVEFELCAVGLNRVRKELDELQTDGESARLFGG